MQEQNNILNETYSTVTVDSKEHSKTQISYVSDEGQVVIIWGAPGVSAASLALGLSEDVEWDEITESEAVALSQTKTWDEARAIKLTEIITAANAMSARIKAKYSQPEIDSWQQQEAEARALLADASAAATLVSDLATNAGVTPLEFAQRIISNADAATAATKAIILQQQGMERAVKEAESVEAVQAVKVEYQLS